MDGFNYEKLQLSQKLADNFQVLELPSEEMLLSYRIDSSQRILSIINNSSFDDPWAEKIPQNSTDGLDSSAFPGNFQDFFYFFDHKGDMAALFNVKLDRGAEIQWAIYLAVSHNYGKKWEFPHRISPDDISIRVMGQPILIEKGSFFGHFVIPVQDTNCCRYLLLFSQDNGKTWNFSLYLEKEDEDSFDLEEPDVLSANKSDFEKAGGLFSIVEGHGGYIHAICRFHYERYLSNSATKDLGTTWSEAQFLSESGLPDFQRLALTKVSLAKDADLHKFLIFGLERGESNPFLSLWVASQPEGSWVKVWQTLVPSNAQVDSCQCAIDTKGKVHLFYNTSKTEIIHLWDDISNRLNPA
jgi:hypothetical protein